MLIGNYSVLNKNPGRALAGSTVSDSRGAWNKSGPSRNLFLSGMDKKTSLPEGAVPPYTWLIPLSPGGLSIRLTASGSMINYAVLGRNCEVSISGTSEMNGSITAIIQMAASLSGSSSVNANMVGLVTMAAILAGTGNLSASMNMIARIEAALNGSGTVTGNLKGKAGMDADIYVNSGAATTNELVAAIWSAMAADFNTPGSMGQKLNGAGSAGDPWTTTLPGTYTGDQAGAIIDRLETLIKQVKAMQAAGL